MNFNRKRKKKMKQQIQKNKTEWKELELKDVAQFVNGRAFKPFEWESKGKLIIRIQDLTGSITNPNYTTKTFDKKYLVKKGDLLISWSATLDAFLWDKEEGWLNQHIFKVVPKKESIYKKYLYYFVKKTIHLFLKESHGSTMKHITKGRFESIKIPIPFSNGKPDLQEQERIVKLLEKAEELTNKSEKAEELLDEYLKSVFYEMFYNKEFEEKTGKELFELTYGKGLSEKQRDGGKYPVYGSNGIVGKHSKFLIEGPGIIIGRKGSIGEVNYSKENFWAIDTTYYVKPLKKMDLAYLYYLLKFYNLKLNSSTAIPGLNRNDVYRINFIDAPLPLQQKFAFIVKQVEKMKEQINKTKQNSEELFNSLISKAFRGEL